MVSAAHAGCYFFLLGRVGVVSCGVTKGVTTALYVYISHMLFCDEDHKKYCVGWAGIIATFFCSSGVMLYAYATAIAPKQPAMQRVASAAGMRRVPSVARCATLLCDDAHSPTNVEMGGMQPQGLAKLLEEDTGNGV